MRIIYIQVDTHLSELWPLDWVCVLSARYRSRTLTLPWDRVVLASDLHAKHLSRPLRCHLPSLRSLITIWPRVIFVLCLLPATFSDLCAIKYLHTWIIRKMFEAVHIKQKINANNSNIEVFNALASHFCRFGEKHLHNFVSQREIKSLI
jgi:hypothetical protein